ncbi:3471_t:CDS:2 [Paraglomus occultum]|uniref:3471_t:CDS:1 n=1 Tax=Paraglomus occultum TaxID=144539 RepID=A0A9N9F263_9GLOM|nr:3471_t:CDS:2 [Paraglomus occultum]
MAEHFPSDDDTINSPACPESPTLGENGFEDAMSNPVSIQTSSETASDTPNSAGSPSSSDAPRSVRSGLSLNGGAQGNGNGYGMPINSPTTFINDRSIRSTLPLQNASMNNGYLINPIYPVAPAPAPAMYWSRIQTHGKPGVRPLRAHTVNLVGELMFVFGGCDARTCFNTVYVFDADTMYWSRPKVYGDPPPSCRAHSSTLVDKRLFIFGGGDGPIYFNDLYVFDTDTMTWSKPMTSGQAPSPRRAHTTVYYNNHVYVFAGGDGVRALNDVYSLDISDMTNLVWKKLEPEGRAPTSRGYHTSNLVGSKMIIYGGSDGHDCFRDVHILDLDKLYWVEVQINKSFPRLSHTSTQVGSYLFIVCGHDGTRYTSEVLLLNLVTMEWESRKVYGVPPSSRGYHTAVLHDSRLFIFGGYDGHHVFDDVYVVDLAACAYLPQITTFQLPTDL